MSSLHRRTFLRHGTAGAATSALAGTALVPRDARAFQQFPVDAAQLATEDGLLQLVKAMVDYGPRHTGNAAHKAYVDHLAQTFAALGLHVMRDTQVFDRWEATAWSLKVERAGRLVPVTVAGYHPYSGSTPPQGITARLVYPGLIKTPPLPRLGDFTSFEAYVQALTQQMRAGAAASAASQPGGVKGAIVLVNIPSLPLFAGIADLVKSDEYDPDRTLDFGTSYRRTWINGFLAALGDLHQALGAVGIVYILDAHPDAAAGQYVPFFSKLKQFPGLLVDRVVGAQLRLQAAAGVKAQLTLTATLERNATTDSLVAVLPGLSAENVVINTHTDGQNAFEENGAAACVALARHYAAKPITQRPRTLVFSLLTGHMVAGLPQGEGFLHAHPDLAARAVASLTIEHFGTTEWLDSPLWGYRATGNPEIAGIFHTGGLRQPALAAVKAVDLRRTLLLKPLFGFIFGVGEPFVAAGIPSLAFITGPEYLVATAPDGHLAKFDQRRMRREMLWCVDVLARMERMTAAQIKG